jgi:hypothetical protein
MYRKSVVVAVPARRNSYEAGHFVFKAGLLFALLLLCFAAKSQGVSEVITDYNGYWKSASSSINAAKPDNSHNLLAFSYHGVRYSTGVNDAALQSHGDNFIAGTYQALPVYQITSLPTANTKIGLGYMYDGVASGASVPAPSNDMKRYLSDGINGLDLGTCVANMPAGNIFLPVYNIRPEAIGDSVPDLLITQIADPSASSLDRYSFTDINGNTIGHTVDIQLNNLPVVGNWTADFYDATTSVLTSGYTRTDRPIRLWTADFSSFGIDASNIQNIAYFKIQLNGNSDVAFVAYNANAFNIVNGVLPSKFTSFSGKNVNQQTTLTWQTATEELTDYFVVEAGHDGATFTAIDTVKAAGTSNKLLTYRQSHVAKDGKTYYRLKLVHKNAVTLYSTIVVVDNKNTELLTVSCYPNPASSTVYMKHAAATGNETGMIMYTNGAVVQQKHLPVGSTQTAFDVQQLPAGTYLLVLRNGNEQSSKVFIKQ